MGYSGTVEIDLVTAFFQLLLAGVKILCNDDAEFNKRFATIVRYVQHSGAWREKVGGYYEISEDDAKKRSSCDCRVGEEEGSVLPDQEREPRQDRATDDLPCVLQLRHELRCAQTLLAEKSHVYKRILELPRVQASDQKDVSALAIFLMDVETRTMTGAQHCLRRGPHPRGRPRTPAFCLQDHGGAVVQREWHPAFSEVSQWQVSGEGTFPHCATYR